MINDNNSGSNPVKVTKVDSGWRISIEREKMPPVLTGDGESKRKEQPKLMRVGDKKRAPRTKQPLLTQVGEKGSMKF